MIPSMIPADSVHVVAGQLSAVDKLLAAFAGVALAVFAVAAVVLLRRVNFAAVSWKSGKEWMENSWLAGLPSTNFKILTTVVLYFLTFCAWALALLLEKPVDEMTFGVWLAFLAGLGGFALAQFAKQRSTDYGAMDRQIEIEKAKQSGAATVVQSAETKVTGSPVTVDGGAPPAPAAPSTPTTEGQ